MHFSIVYDVTDVTNVFSHFQTSFYFKFYFKDTRWEIQLKTALCIYFLNCIPTGTATELVMSLCVGTQ